MNLLRTKQKNQMNEIRKIIQYSQNCWELYYFGYKLDDKLKKKNKSTNRNLMICLYVITKKSLLK